MIEEYLILRLLLETAQLLSIESISSGLFEPVLISNIIPNRDLTIDDLRISPIDDHITYGVAF